jgi:predicted transcriptional regulator
MEHALKHYRTSVGIRISQLARAACTSRQSIHRIEKGEQTPSLDLVRRLVDATEGNVTAADFVAASVPERERREGQA